MTKKEVINLFYSQNRATLNKENETKLFYSTLRYLKTDEVGEIYTILGRMYYEGFCVEQNYTRARKLFIYGSRKNNAEALAYLGYCHYYGREIDKNYAYAFHYFTKSANQNNHCAIYKLGDMYKYGYHVKADEYKALNYYKKALKLINDESTEYPNILSRIGDCVLDGIGCDKDPLKALLYLNESEFSAYKLLLKGDPYAHLTLGFINDAQTKAKKILNDIHSNYAHNVKYT